MNRQKLALFILLILLVLAIIWSVISVPRQKRVAKLKYAPGLKHAANSAVSSTKQIPVTASASDDRVLRLDLLEREQSGFKGYRRNIFKPIFMDEIKLMKLKAIAVRPVPIPPVAVQPPKVAPQPVIVSQEKIEKTLAHFVYLGFLKKGNRRTIFLSRDNEIILVRKGDKFADRYEAKSVTDQTLTIVTTDTGQEIVIPLIEDQPLVAATGL